MTDLTPDQKQELIRRMNDGGIKRVYRKKTLMELGEAGKVVRAYISGKAEKIDAKNSVGVFLAADLAKEAYLLPVFAKEQVLLGRPSVFFIYLQELLWALTEEENTRTLETARKARHLCIAWFQTNTERPYTEREVYILSQFLIGRIESGRRTSFSACKRLHLCDWWPEELRGMLRGVVREISLGKRK